MPAIFMTDTQLLEQLYIIYSLLSDGNHKQAEQVFKALQIVDSPEHLSLPKNTRHLIWNLHEYLVLGEETNATDKQQIITEFQDLFPEKK